MLKQQAYEFIYCMPQLWYHIRLCDSTIYSVYTILWTWTGGETPMKVVTVTQRKTSDWLSDTRVWNTKHFNCWWVKDTIVSTWIPSIYLWNPSPCSIKQGDNQTPFIHSLQLAALKSWKVPQFTFLDFLTRHFCGTLTLTERMCSSCLFIWFWRNSLNWQCVSAHRLVH